MSKERFAISDTHFFHEKLLTFKKDGGHLCREQFDSIAEMNETIVDNWNRVVKPGDQVLHCGDVALGLKDSEYKTLLHPLLNRLNGKKILILGNHDKPKNEIIRNHFSKIELWKRYETDDEVIGLTFTHIPLRLEQVRTNARYNFNVHGHIHDGLIEDPYYINICVEHTNYTPIHYDDLILIARARMLENALRDA